MRREWVWVALIVGACSGKGDDSAGANEADADTDADTDSDSDTDTDTDTDTDPAPIEGSLTFEMEVNGDTLCDATIAFEGTPYTGACPGCDFLYDVEATLVRDDGNGACPFQTGLSLYNVSARITDPTFLGFASKLPYDPSLEPYKGPYYDALVTGYGVYTDDTGGELVVIPLTGNSSRLGVATFDGTELTWDLSAGLGGYVQPDFAFELYPKVSTCTLDWISRVTAPYADGNTVLGSQPCGTPYVDVFTFEGSVGGTAYITVDTRSDSPALWPEMWVYGPDSCVERFAAYNFDCTVGVAECPSMSLETEPGEYTLVVGNSSDCGASNGDLADYRLDIDASWDPKLAPVRDDVLNEGPATLHVQGSAIITPK